MTLLDISAAALTASGAVATVFAFSTVSALYRRGAPFVPTARRKINTIMSKDGLLQGLRPQQRAGMHVVDLGSGGGALVRSAVREGGFARATGYELNPGLIAWSRLLSCTSTTETFHLQDLWTADVSDADVVFVYGVPSILEKLEKKLATECRPATLVVSNAFPFAATRTSSLALLDTKFVDAGLRSLELDDSSYIYLYRISSANEPSPVS